MSPILQGLANGSARGYGGYLPLGAAGAFESIASITLSSSTVNNDFTNIPQTYAALQIRFIGRLDDAGSGAGALRIRVGNSTFDTGSNYARHN